MYPNVLACALGYINLQKNAKKCNAHVLFGFSSGIYLCHHNINIQTFEL